SAYPNYNFDYGLSIDQALILFKKMMSDPDTTVYEHGRFHGTIADAAKDRAEYLESIIAQQNRE
ncbi:MAG: hypothetical protein AAF267_19720, partial [Deinococcota bacterium]